MLRAADPQFATIDLDQFLPLGTTLFDDPVAPGSILLLQRGAVETVGIQGTPQPINTWISVRRFFGLPLKIGGFIV